MNLINESKRNEGKLSRIKHTFVDELMGGKLLEGSNRKIGQSSLTMK